MADLTQSDMSLDEFNMWKVPQLKAYLRCRGLKTTGRKEELVALAYGAHCLRVPVNPSADETSILKAKQYKSLLYIDGKYLPDPFVDLSEGWMTEENGMEMWPPTMQFDIAEYLLADVQTDRDFGKRLMSDYKEGKAYSYFDSKWLKNISYHPIADNSKLCFLMSESTPSQNISHTPHKMWVLVHKESGKIVKAYCTCFAGLGSTCNHVAAILFKVECAWRMGWTNKACTSKPCEWNQFGSQVKNTTPKPICEMDWRKPHYRKSGKGEKTINPVARKLFKPTNSSAISSNTKPPSIERLLNSMYISCSNSSVFQYVRIDEAPTYPSEADMNVAVNVEVNTSASIPPSLPELTNGCNEPADFVTQIPILTDAEVAVLEEETRQQADCTVWEDQRKGRITASVAHNVMTKMNTVSSATTSRSKDTTALVKRIMGYTKVKSDIPALKYGKLMELEARDSYAHELVSLEHKHVKVKESGLCVLPHAMYIGASPDGFVSCSCCGEGLLEIKCPLSIAHMDPQKANLPYMEKNATGSLKLRESHAYYTQIQTQMGVTHRSWCDFFVYTRHGHHLERILFNKTKWELIMNAITQFFHIYLVPELTSKTIENAIKITEPTSSVEVDTSILGSSAAISSPNILTTSQRRKPKVAKRKRGISKPIYLCGICSSLCKEAPEITENDDNSVGCDNCYTWFHWGCVGYDNQDNDSDHWLCQNCESE